jgi:hypothetical protein
MVDTINTKKEKELRICITTAIAEITPMKYSSKVKEFISLL